MRLELFVLCCILQLIQGFERSDVPSILRFNTFRWIVAGGLTARKNQFPFQCSLQLSTEPWCGCAIINSNFVLTASHCIDGYSEKQFRIMVGSTELRSGGTYYNVERLIPHEHYNTPKGAYDIALVKVMGEFEFSENVQPIQLEDKDVPDGAEVVVTGWGRVKEDYIPNKLQYATLYVLDKDECRKAQFGEHVQDHHICTYGILGTGACKGDSGGALTYNDKLVGITNFGIPCGVGIPDVFAKVSFFIDWIANHTTLNDTPDDRLQSAINQAVKRLQREKDESIDY